MTANQIDDYRGRAEHLKKLFPGLNVCLAGSWVWIDGDTKPHASELKAEGCRFSRKKVKWYLKGIPARSRGGVPFSYIQEKYGIEEIG